MEGPDGGYSWVVVVCCSFIHFALFGIFRSSGVVYVAMLERYDVSREEASWPFALAAGIFQLTGPLASLLTHYISQRKAMILGSIIATAGVAGCYFAQNIHWFNIFYGIVHGVGFGIMATLLTVTLNQYFLKYRATAIGFAFAGGSISSLVFPIVMEWLLESYTLTDSFLLLSGVVMNTLVAASLLRAPPWLNKPKEEQLEIFSERRDSGVGSPDDFSESTKSNVYKVAPQADPDDCEMSDTEHMDTFQKSRNYQPGFAESGTKREETPEADDTLGSNNDSVLFDGSYSKVTVSSKGEKNVENGAQKPLMCDVKNVYIIPKKEKTPEIFRPDKVGLRHSISSILKEPIFYKIALTMIIYFLGVHSTFMVIVDFAKDKGISEDKGVYIVSMFSLTDLFGRAGLGWVTDRNYISRRDMVCLNLMILGILYELYPVINAYSGILVIAGIQGLAVGCSITLFFVIQAESMGLKNLTLVVGLTSFINGVATFFRPGIIGLFRDVIGSYNWMFHAIGGITLVFAGMWFVEAYRAKVKTTSVICDDKV